MKTVLGVLVLFMLFSGDPFLHSGDSVDLVALKKKEEKRRKTTKKSKYTLTNSNLNSIEVPDKKYGFVQLTGYLSLVGDEKQKLDQDAQEEKDPKKKRKYWVELKTNLEKEIGVLREKVKEDQLRLNRLVTNHISMSLPLQKIDLKNQIDKLSATLENEKLKLETLEQRLKSLPEQARKAGVPPGWVR